MIQAHAAGDPFEALGDPNRRDILRLLSEGDKPVRDIAAALVCQVGSTTLKYRLRAVDDLGLAEVTHDPRNNQMRAI
jgi:DNA-binding transcriptional ArsR family regulator